MRTKIRTPPAAILFFNAEAQSREGFRVFGACPLTLSREVAEAVGTLRRFPLRRGRRGLRCDIIYRLIYYLVKYCAALCELGRAQTLAPRAVCAPLRPHAERQLQCLCVLKKAESLRLCASALKKQPHSLR